MKKLLLFLVLAASSFMVKAQSADELFTKGDYVKAADEYSKLYKADTTNVTTARRLAFCYLQTENAKHLAQYYFQKALNNNPNDMASNYYMGVYYKQLLASPNSDKVAVKNKALKYLSRAASLGSEDAKADLNDLK